MTSRPAEISPSPPLRGGEGRGEVGRSAPGRCHPSATPTLPHTRSRTASAATPHLTPALSAPQGRRGGDFSCANREAGFTLIEILVAFTIVALMLGALYQLFATGLRSGATAENYESAVLLAESGIDALNGTALAVDSTSERIGRFERHTSVAPRADLLPTEALSVPMLYELTVRVDWREGVRERSVTLSTLRAGPRDLPR
jgi:general secretion pathway protein I